jgi:hypothetical protein
VTPAVLKGRADILAETRRAIEAKPGRAADAARLRLDDIEAKIDAALSETRDECWALCDEWCGKREGGVS